MRSNEFFRIWKILTKIVIFALITGLWNEEKSYQILQIIINWPRILTTKMQSWLVYTIEVVCSNSGEKITFANWPKGRHNTLGEIPFRIKENQIAVRVWRMCWWTNISVTHGKGTTGIVMCQEKLLLFRKLSWYFQFKQQNGRQACIKVHILDEFFSFLTTS